jgi:hypothetical protein
MEKIISAVLLNLIVAPETTVEELLVTIGVELKANVSHHAQSFKTNFYLTVKDLREDQEWTTIDGIPKKIIAKIKLMIGTATSQGISISTSISISVIFDL